MHSTRDPAHPVLGIAVGSMGFPLSAYAAGILAADQGWVGIESSTAALGVGSLALALLVVARVFRCAAVAPLCIWVAIALAGGLRFASHFALAAREPIAAPEIALLEGRVESARGNALRLEQVRRIDPGPRVPRRVLLREPRPGTEGLRGWPPGTWLRTRARLTPWPERRNPGGRDRRRSARRRGLGAQAWRLESAPVLRIRHAGGEARRVLRNPLPSLHQKVDSLRQGGASILREEGRGGALLAALALGDRQGIAPVRDAFRTLGLSHLLAISGLHLALVGVAAYRAAGAAIRRLPPVVVARVGDARSVALLLSLAFAGAYTLVSGAAVPVLRAWWMAFGFGVAWGLRRPVHRATPLHLAAAGLLVLDPAALFDPGVQLSFAACYAIVARRACEAKRGRGVAHSADLIAATAPIAAASLGVASPWGLVANVVAVPWTAVVLLPTALVAALATGLPRVIGAPLLRAAAHIGEISVDAAASVANALPFSVDTAVAPTGIALAMAAAWCVLRTPSLAAKALGAVVVPTLLLAWPPPTQTPRSPRALFFDVGQGDAALVQSVETTVLIDGGNAVPGRAGHGATTLGPALRALGIRHLDLVIATHRDLDHRGGLLHIVDALSVGALWVPWHARSDPAFDALLERARMRGVAVVETGRGAREFSRALLRVTPLWPPRTWPGSANDRSLVVRVDVRAEPGAEARRLLFAGDIHARAESALLADARRLRASVLKLPHHGSRTSSTRRFLRAVSPDVAVASSARFHRFGMPHPEVCRRVRKVGAPLWHTGSDGAVWVALTTPMWVRGELAPRSGSACPP